MNLQNVMFFGPADKSMWHKEPHQQQKPTQHKHNRNGTHVNRKHQSQNNRNGNQHDKEFLFRKHSTNCVTVRCGRTTRLMPPEGPPLPQPLLEAHRTITNTRGPHTPSKAARNQLHMVAKHHHPRVFAPCCKLTSNGPLPDVVEHKRQFKITHNVDRSSLLLPRLPLLLCRQPHNAADHIAMAEARSPPL